jgi:hypothetical protein
MFGRAIHPPWAAFSSARRGVRLSVVGTSVILVILVGDVDDLEAVLPPFTITLRTKPIPSA